MATTSPPNVTTSITEKNFVNNDDTSSDLKKGGIDLEQVSELSSEPIPPPDGGLKAWLTVFGAFCVSYFFVVNQLLLVKTEIKQDINAVFYVYSVSLQRKNGLHI